jgi:hypothetical protein
MCLGEQAASVTDISELTTNSRLLTARAPSHLFYGTGGGGCG